MHASVYNPSIRCHEDCGGCWLGKNWRETGSIRTSTANERWLRSSDPESEGAAEAQRVSWGHAGPVHHLIQGNEGGRQLVPGERDRNQRDKGSGRGVPETKGARESRRATWLSLSAGRTTCPRVLNASLPH